MGRPGQSSHRVSARPAPGGPRPAVRAAPAGRGATVGAPPTDLTVRGRDGTCLATMARPVCSRFTPPTEIRRCSVLSATVRAGGVIVALSPRPRDPDRSETTYWHIKLGDRMGRCLPALSRGADAPCGTAGHPPPATAADQAAGLLLAHGGGLAPRWQLRERQHRPGRARGPCAGHLRPRHRCAEATCAALDPVMARSCSPPTGPIASAAPRGQLG